MTEFPEDDVLRQLINEWAAWQATRSVPRSVVERRRTVLRFARVTDPLSASTVEITEWMAVQAWMPATRQSQFAYLRHFYRWMQRVGWRVDDPTAPIDAPKVPRAQPRPASTEGIVAVIDTGRIRLRTRMMVMLAMYQGLRVHEVAKVKASDIDGSTLWVDGKGGVRAALPLHPEVRRYAERHAHLFPLRRGGWWFAAAGGAGHVRGSSVSETLANAFRRVGYDYTAHQLRHWYGTEVHRAGGGNLLVTQQLMRHASPGTTAGYALIDDSERRAASDALPVIRGHRESHASPQTTALYAAPGADARWRAVLAAGAPTHLKETA